MNTLTSLLAPYEPSRRWGYLNLESEAKKAFNHESIDNPLLDPVFAAAWVEHLHRRDSIDRSYGGYMEDRPFMHYGQYMGSDHCVHLGVDVNGLAVGTPIHCPVPFTLIDEWEDPDQNGGWGGRIVVRLESGLYIVFGHLNLWSLSGRYHKPYHWIYSAGTQLGMIAPHTRNGGWFPHLHVQACVKHPGVRMPDGYAAASPALKHLYPEPLAALNIGDYNLV